MKSNTIQVFGVGSPLGDDAIGWMVIDGLVDALREKGILVQSLDRPGVALLQHFNSASALIIVDAVAGVLNEGEVGRFGADQAYCFEQPWSSHGVGLGQALALADALGTLPPRVEIVGIGVGAHPDLVQMRSVVARAAAPAKALTRQIIEQLAPHR